MRNGTISCYRTKDDCEIDFIVGDAIGLVPYELVQVSVSLSDARTRKREVQALVQACRECGLNSGTIVTLRQEELIQEEGVSIRVIPAWKWFLR